MKQPKYTNRLISEASPYLLQHAHNPVNWHPYSAEILSKAKKNGKLLVISIGYAACHWCHVMEHESFEDEEVAKIMNRDFISIKVDREERPDIDQVYMNAVQLMTGTGGWPLNIVALPDGRPIWGGTYFRKDQWIDALSQIQELYIHEPEKLISYANRLEQGMKSMDLIIKNENEIDFKNLNLNSVAENLSSSFDAKNGGFSQAPKFMMPNTLEFVLRYAQISEREDWKDFIELTLNKMAHGGIYDQISGGFSRYSVDEKWHIPHFEKMLYDNALLISLYSKAYSATKNPLYKEISLDTIAFVERELTHESGIYFSALDADSLNEENRLEEGAFYSFTFEELQKTIQNDFNIFSEYYNINEYGRWENNSYILIRTLSDSEIAGRFGLPIEKLQQKKEQWKTLLFHLKNQRTKPRLDDKSLTSWNALMISALIDAHKAYEDKNHLENALLRAHFLIDKQMKEDYSLFHMYKNGKSSVVGFLEDYAFTIEMAINLYEVTFDWKWMELAGHLTDYTIENFFDTESHLFYFTNHGAKSVIQRIKEYYDNVLPSSNSVMAKNLFRLSKFLSKPNYEEMSEQMLKNVLEQLENHPRGFGNWLDLLLNFKFDFYEIIMAGNDIHSLSKNLNKNYLPQTIIAGTEQPDEKDIFKNRFQEGETLIYICKNNVCRQPVRFIEEILKQIKEK